MARAITQIQRAEITEEEQRLQDLQEIEAILIEHKDSLRAFLEVLEKVNERGGLDLASGLFERGDEVLHVLVKAADHPGATNILKNGLLLIGALGRLNIEKMMPIIEKLNGGIEQASEWSEGERSLISLIGQTNWKENLMFLMAFLKGIGGSKEKQGEEKNKSGWLIAAAGLSLAGLMLLRRR
ncbi:DUF1641 domain-containing protein [Bacillus xiapuensis]|uniref:DUF1641 domain-containing protein n=1 Tax=Bacillus xiapuensis TaxID=2014075 RepID=UPI000C23AAFA|nr:DUF1641 domain-containing protein [Bacillus xiapuensis]